MPKVHVLTLTWNGADKLRKLHPTLLKNLDGLDFHWHIRDNGSQDDTVSMALGWDNSTIYNMGHNRDNFAVGMNYLFDKSEAADDDYILLLNNDIIFNGKASVRNMIDLQNKTRADVIGARLLYTKTNKLQHAGVIFSKMYNYNPFHYRHGEPTDALAKKNRYFQAVTAAVCLMRAGAFREVGGFWDGLNWCFDDIDLILRVGQLKANNVAYCGTTDIYHDESATLKKNPMNQLFMGSNVQKFKGRWWEAGKPKYKIDHELYLKDPKHNEII